MEKEFQTGLDIVTKFTEGKTHLNIDGLPVVVSDTAGIRDSKDEIEKKGIKLALKSAHDADLNLVIIEPKSVYFTGFLKELTNSSKSILVVNKSDLGLEDMVYEFKKYNPIYISIKNEKTGKLYKFVLEEIDG